MFLKSILLFLYFQVCQSRVKILSYTFMNDHVELENKINDFEFYNNVHYYDIIQSVSNPTTFLIIFNDEHNNIPSNEKYRNLYEQVMDSSNGPTLLPSAFPSASPSAIPTLLPSAFPSASPSTSPTSIPTETPSLRPSHLPTSSPTPLPIPPRRKNDDSSVMNHTNDSFPIITIPHNI